MTWCGTEGTTTTLRRPLPNVNNLLLCPQIYQVAAEVDPDPQGQYLVWTAHAKDSVFHRRWPSGTWESRGTFRASEMQFIDPDRGFCGGLDLIEHMVTTDRGLNWTPVNPGINMGDVSMVSPWADVCVARLPTKPGDDEEDVVLSKLLKYQTAPPAEHLQSLDFLIKWAVGLEPFWEYESLMTTSWWADHELEDLELYDPLAGPGWQGDVPLTLNSALWALNDGFQFACHHCHAGPRDWMVGGEVGYPEYLNYVSLLNGEIANGDRTGIAVSGGCHAGYLMDDSAIGRCFLLSPYGGSVAYSGFTIANFGIDELGALLIEAVYGQECFKLGLAHKVATFLRHTQRPRNGIFEALLGDPTMDVWTRDPAEFDVSHMDAVSTEDTDFEVTVLDSSSTDPVPGALVLISVKDPETGQYPVYYRAETGSDGVARFVELYLCVAGEMVVTATKHNYLPHRSTCRIVIRCGHGFATANSQQRNIVRVPGTNNLHLVYSDAGAIMHSASPNGGVTWSRPEFIDYGERPAVTLNYDQAGGQNRTAPWVAYLQNGDVRVAILENDQSPVFVTLFDGTYPDSVAGPPAIVACPVPDPPCPTAWATYNVIYDVTGDPWYRVYARKFTELQQSDPDILDEQTEYWCGEPAIAITPGDEVHVAWRRDCNTVGSIIWYKRYITEWLEDAIPVSNYRPNARCPFIEVWGDSCWAVFTSGGEVYWAGRQIGLPPGWWTTPADFSQSPGVESDCPVQALGNVRAWEEGNNDQTDIFVRHGEVTVNLSNTPTQTSAFPSIDAYYDDVVGKTLVNAVWTEELVPNELYEVVFKQYEPDPGFGPGRGQPRYVAVATGDSCPSPYCRYRDGGIKYGPYSLDYARDTLRYVLPYLDPVYDYWVRAVVYHEGEERWSQGVRLGDSLRVLVETEPRKPETIWVQVPVKAYQGDGVADLAA
ncbi:MAG: hypothetical protein JSU73_10825, partial [candidate division WOR-3 bacterium]